MNCQIGVAPVIVSRQRQVNILQENEPNYNTLVIS